MKYNLKTLFNLGVFLFSCSVMHAQYPEIPKEVQALVAQRETARTEKNWKQSDVLRAKIEEAGYTVEDTQSGAKLKEKRPKV